MCTESWTYPPPNGDIEQQLDIEHTLWQRHEDCKSSAPCNFLHHTITCSPMLNNRPR